MTCYEGIGYSERVWPDLFKGDGVLFLKVSAWSMVVGNGRETVRCCGINKSKYF